MSAWEYRKSLDEGELEDLGREGWELVAALPGGGGAGAVFYFKRPGPDFREEVTLDQKERYYKLMGIQASSNGDGHKP